MRKSLLAAGVRYFSTSASPRRRQSMMLRGLSPNHQSSIFRNRHNPHCWKRHVRRSTLTTGREGPSKKTTDGKEEEKEPDNWTEWIPPDRPLAGDQGQSHLYATKDDNENEPEVITENDEEEELRLIEQQLRRMEEQGEPQQQSAADDEDGVVDWTVNRHRAMQDEHSPTHMLPPSQAQSHKDSVVDDMIPIKPYTLLSKDEIAKCMTSLGGSDVTVILDNPLDRRMGGVHGLILVTGTTSAQLRMLATALVRQLRLRTLEERHVVGAQLGFEGDAAQQWLVVDCRNYVVHIQDEVTRRAVDLESLWSGQDGLHRVNVLDENAIDDYVASHPVPREYSSGIAVDMDPWMRLQKNRFTAPHRPVIPTKQKRKIKRKRR